MMEKLIILVLTATSTIAIPSGYYHGEQEFQHTTNGQSSFSRRRDLGGQNIPQVITHKQYPEYLNPKLQDSSGPTKFDLGNDIELINLKELPQTPYRNNQEAQVGTYSSLSSESSYSSYSQSSSSFMIEIKKQIHEKMEQQIQTAINGQRQDLHSSAGNFQAAFELLTNQINQNLTQQIKNLYKGDNAQFETLKRELQIDLQKKLQNGLQHSCCNINGNNNGANNAITDNHGLNQIKTQMLSRLQTILQSTTRLQRCTGGSYSQTFLQQLNQQLNNCLTRELAQLRSQSAYLGHQYDVKFFCIEKQLRSYAQEQLQSFYNSISLYSPCGRNSRYASSSSSARRILPDFRDKVTT